MEPSVISITSDKMGQGDDELGAILMQAFINTLKKQSPLPATVIFYNAGVLLCQQDSPVVPALTELSELGVKLILCGTCVDFYGIKDKLAIGEISNMFTIQETLNHAARIIAP